MKKTSILLFVIILLNVVSIFLLIRLVKEDNLKENVKNEMTDSPTNNNLNITYDEIIIQNLKTNDDAIVDTNFRFFDKQFVLIEKTYKSNYKEFNIINTYTKEHLTLPSNNTIAEFYQYNNANDIEFLSRGLDINTSIYTEFPYIIKCFRANDRTEYNIMTQPFYLNLWQEVIFGKDYDDAIIYDVLEFDNSVKIYFKPKDINDMDFYLPFAYIPKTYTHYRIDKTINVDQLIFEFKNTQHNVDKTNDNNFISNKYFDKIELHNEDKDCQLIINLLEGTEKYNATVEYEKDENNKEIPCLLINFQ